MTIQLRSLSELDQATVSQNLAETIARIQEDNPTLDMRMGVFFATLAYYHALLGTQLDANLADYLNARSLAQIEADPALALPELVDDILSNYLIVRQPGMAANGSVTIILSRQINTVIAAGAVFEATGGARFLTEDVFTAKLASDHVILPTDRVLVQTPDGNWSFTIEVVAEAAGANSQIKKDTSIAPLVKPNFYLNSFATSDFSDGQDAETNAELLNKLQIGIAGKHISNRTQMQAMLRDVDAFNRVTSMSIIGLGNAEMLRDQHTIWPMHLGGRVDWYIRSQEQVFGQAITKDATLVQIRDDGSGLWQIAIGRDEAPGFYEITSIRPAGNPQTDSLAVYSDVRALNTTGLDVFPDMLANSTEWIYSRYQTAVIQFIDGNTSTASLAIGAKKSYDLEARGMPLIAEIQDYVAGRNVSHHGADCLVKAPIPCFVTLRFTVYKQSGAADPDTTAMKTALCHEVNVTDFIGRLYASRLQGTAQSYLHDATSLSAIDMFGRLRYPDSSIKYLRSNSVLTITNAAASAMVSPKTVQFFLAPEDIHISIETAVPSND